MSHDQDPMIWTHGMADIESGLRLHYVTAGIGPRVVVLLHGFPQTWRLWHRVIAPLVDAGFRVVAPDYRGAGDSWRPPGGYDKRTMANDIRQLLRQHLRIEDPIALVGHDIGMMIAYPYAQAHRDEVSHLAVVDAPLPGTAVFDLIRSDPRVAFRLPQRPRCGGNACRRARATVPAGLLQRAHLRPFGDR
jgi:pimeloyl-ACP methyl ester carboxylesterase